MPEEKPLKRHPHRELKLVMLGSVGSRKYSVNDEAKSHKKAQSQERRPPNPKKRVLMVKILKDKHGILETLLSESVKELPSSKSVEKRP